MSLEKDIPINVDGTSSLYAETDDQSTTDDTETSAEDLDKLSGKTLTFIHADFPWRDISIIQDDTPLYYADISVFTPGKPDITLHSRSEHGPIVGQAHFRRSLSIKAGVGPDDTSMCWTNMKRGGVLHRNYAFEFRGKIYALRRTHSASNGVATPHQKAMFSHMKIVEQSTGEVAAVYVSKMPVRRKRGTIKLAKDVSSELEILCVLGFASWREKIARRAGRSRAVSIRYLARYIYAVSNLCQA